MSLIDHLDYCRPRSVDEMTTCDEETSSNEKQVNDSRNNVFEMDSSGEISANEVSTSEFFQVKVRGRSCFLCNKVFATQFTLNRHLFTQHKVKVNSGNRLLQCPVDKCLQCFSFMDILRAHLKDFHQIAIRDGSMLRFQTFDMFLEWKSEEEKRTFTKFVRPHGKYRRHDGAEVHQFYCHRSGYYNPEGKGLRKLKSQGSCKMGSACPATITAFRLASDEVDCKYFSTHVGHITDLEELYFTSQERGRVIEMLANNSPFQSILNSVRNWLSCDMDILSELSKELRVKIDSYIDQWNHIKSAKGEHCGHFTNMIEELVSFGVESPVVCSRLPQEGSLLDVEDHLVVILMTAFQTNIIKKYGNDGIVCISSTRDSERPDQLFLTFVCVMYDDKTVLPCVFCVSNKLDLEVYSELVEAIKVRAGLVRPKLLMVDDRTTLQEVWSRVMEQEEKTLLCSWFVDAEWRKHLCKIAGKPYQKVGFYKALRVLLKECDQTKYSVLSATLMHCLKSKYTEPFGVYLEKEWMSQMEQWAFAYRDSKCALSDLQFEAMHLVFVDLCSPQSGHSIDVILQVLLRISRENMLNFYSVLSPERRNWLSAMVKTCHQSCLLFSFRNVVLVDVGKWVVQTSQGDFNVFRCEDKCPCDGNCMLKCEACNVCIHCYTCSCATNVVHGTVCEHIHLVGHHIIEPESNKSDEFVLQVPADVQPDFSDELLLQMVSPRLKQSVDEVVVEIVNLSQQIAFKAKEIADVSTLQCLRDNLKLILCASTPMTVIGSNSSSQY